MEIQSKYLPNYGLVFDSTFICYLLFRETISVELL